MPVVVHKMMRMIVTLSAVSLLCGCAAAPEKPQAAFRTVPVEQSVPTVYVREDAATLDAAAAGMKHVVTRPQAKPCSTRDEAGVLLRSSIHIPHRPSSCAFVEHNGFLMFSTLCSTEPDDGSFSSGYAVKKGTSEIYSWNLGGKAQQSAR